VLQRGNLAAENAAAHPDIGQVLNHIEAILIAAAEPVQNRQGGKFGQSVKQYLQYRDKENIGPDSNNMLREIWAKLQDN
jgi:hypothetical protein